MDRRPESLLLYLFQFLLRRIAPAKPRIDFECNVKSESTPLVDQVAGTVKLVDANGFLLAPRVSIHAVGPAKNILPPGQLTSRYLFKVEGDCYPIRENLAIRHPP